MEWTSRTTGRLALGLAFVVVTGVAAVLVGRALRRASAELDTYSDYQPTRPQPRWRRANPEATLH